MSCCSCRTSHDKSVCIWTPARVHFPAVHVSDCKPTKSWWTTMRVITLNQLILWSTLIVIVGAVHRSEGERSRRSKKPRKINKFRIRIFVQPRVLDIIRRDIVRILRDMVNEVKRTWQSSDVSFWYFETVEDVT